MPETYEILKDAGMALVMVWVLVWMFTKHIPQREAAYERQIKEARDSFLKALDGELREVKEALQKSRDMMAEHDRAFSDRLPKCMRNNQEER